MDENLKLLAKVSLDSLQLSMTMKRKTALETGSSIINSCFLSADPHSIMTSLLCIKYKSHTIVVGGLVRTIKSSDPSSGCPAWLNQSYHLLSAPCECIHFVLFDRLKQ